MRNRLAVLCVLGLSLCFVACGHEPESATPAPEQQQQRPVTPPANAKLSLQWVSNDIPQTMAPGANATIHVKVKNTGDWTWPDKKTANPSNPDGSYAVRLGYRWAKPAGTLLPENLVRADLSASLAPDASADFVMDVIGPNEPGTYQLQVDLVAEKVTWFSAKGNQKLVAPVTVQ